MKTILLYWRSKDFSLLMSMSAISSYLSDQVPNPSKVLVILEELGLPYETSWVELEDLKKEPYESVNPNGRVPGIIEVFSILVVPNNVDKVPIYSDRRCKYKHHFVRVWCHNILPRRYLRQRA